MRFRVLMQLVTDPVSVDIEAETEEEAEALARVTMTHRGPLARAEWRAIEVRLLGPRPDRVSPPEVLPTLDNYTGTDG